MDSIEIKDIYLAAYLKSEGITLESFEKRDQYTVFIFRNNDKVGKLIDQYIRDEAKINIKLFRNNLKDLKSIACGDIPVPRNRK